MDFKPLPTNKFRLYEKVNIKNSNGNWERRIRTITAVPGELNTAYAGGQYPRGNYQIDHSEYINRNEADIRPAVATRRRGRS